MRFWKNGFNYFDTAHGYLGGKSEMALKTCLTSRYPRDRYILTNKLTILFFKKQGDIRPFLESQLAACGVEYFDIYLMHIALSLELFVNGSLNIFNHQTNVDVDNRFTVYGIRDLGTELSPITMLVMMESIQNRIIANER